MKNLRSTILHRQAPLETARPKGPAGARARARFLRRQEGYFISVMTIFILIIMSTIVLSMGALIFHRQRISTNSVKSSQSYYTAEAGVEDALFKLSANPQIAPTTYNLSVGNTSAAVNIPAVIGTSRAVTSAGNDTNRLRTIQVVYNIDSDAVGFHYGAQIGAGGLSTSNNSVVNGNVFSNGNVTGSGKINNNLVIAGEGNSINGVTVVGNAVAHSCISATIQGNLTYVDPGGTQTCTVNGFVNTQPSAPTQEAMPISDAKILEWKADAEAGGVVAGDYTLTSGATGSLGPKKITGKLTISNNATLTITGTLYVVGDIAISNNGLVRLSPSYGGLSGLLISDKAISLSNNGILQGSGQAGSYIMLLSTDPSDSAISIHNNATGAIFYASAGKISVSNNVSAKQITGYKVHLNNNATINYESGLASALFSSGPSAGWKVTDWKEQ